MQRNSVPSAWCERALIFLGAVFYLFVFPHGTHGDGFVRYEAVTALASRHEWLLHKYPMLGPLCSLPLYYLGLLWKEPHWWVSRFNAFCLLGFLAVFFRLLRAEWPDAGGRRRLVLLLLVGTMFPKHATDYYGEMFTVALATLSLALVTVKRRAGGLAGLALASMSSPPTLVGTAAAGLRLAWAEKRLRYFLPVIAGFLLIAGENLLRFGSVSNPIYLNDVVDSRNVLEYARLNGFHYPFWFGFLSIWLSFGKGLVFYCSGLLLLPAGLRLLPARLREFQWSAAAYVIGLALIYSKWCAWSGDWFWGPRFFLFAGVPATLALHAFLEKSRSGAGEALVVLALLTLSAWVGLNGVAFGQNNLEICGADGGYLGSLCWYTPDYSPLWRPFFAEKGLTGKQAAFAAYFGLAYLYLSRPLWAFLWRSSAETLAATKRTLAEWRL